MILANLALKVLTERPKTRAEFRRCYMERIPGEGEEGYLERRLSMRHYLEDIYELI